MKKILLLILFIWSIALAQTTPVTQLSTITLLKAYNGTSGAVVVTDSSTQGYFKLCPGCVADEMNVYAGVNGKKWSRLKDAQLVAQMSKKESTKFSQSGFNGTQFPGWPSSFNNTYNNNVLGVYGINPSIDILIDSLSNFGIGGITFRSQKAGVPLLPVSRFGSQAYAKIEANTFKNSNAWTSTVEFYLGDSTNSNVNIPLSIDGAGPHFFGIRKYPTADAGNALYFGTRHTSGTGYNSIFDNLDTYLAGDAGNKPFMWFNLPSITADTVNFKPLVINNASTDGRVYKTNWPKVFSFDTVPVYNAISSKADKSMTVNGHSLTSSFNISPSDLSPDATHRWLTDALTTSWNNKLAPSDTSSLSSRINSKLNPGDTLNLAARILANFVAVAGKADSSETRILRDSSAAHRLAISRKPRVFNVLDYGADPTFTTDSKAAIQAAINACFAAGGGVVFFPMGHYKLSGSLVTSDNRGFNPNSQLYIPSLKPDATNLTSFASRCHIELMGEGKNNQTLNGIVSNFGPAPTGVSIESTLSSVSGLTPSILGGIDTTTLFGSINYNYVSVRNINFYVPYSNTTGPIMSGINGRDITSLQIEDVAVTQNKSYTSNFVLPTNECFGIMMAKNNGDADNYVKNSICTGFKYGLVFTEHVVVEQVSLGSCTYALTQGNAGHPALVTRIGPSQCRNFIYFPSSNILGMTAGPGNLQITQMNIELQRGGSAWTEYQQAVVDSSNYGRGFAYYKIFNVVNQTNADYLWSTYGGAYYRARPLINAFVDMPLTITSSVTLNNSTSIVSANSTSGNLIINLPPASTVPGKSITVKKIAAANTVTLDPYGSEAIEGQSTLVLSNYGAASTVYSDSTQWITAVSDQTQNSLASLKITGTAGVGRIELPTQSNTVASPASGSSIYSNSLGYFSLVNPLGYEVAFNNTGINGARQYTLPNTTGTLAMASDIPTNGTGITSTPSAGTGGVYSNDLITGIAAGQTIIGGNNTGTSLGLRSNNSAGAKGYVVFGTANTTGYDETNDRFAFGAGTPSAKVHILATTEQLRYSYDPSNYTSHTVSSAGIKTETAVGTAPQFVFNKNVADAVALIVGNQVNASSTGDLLVLQLAGSTKFNVTSGGNVAASGNITTSGSLNTSLTAANANFSSQSNGVATYTTSQLLFGGASTVGARIIERGSAGFTMVSTNAYANHIMGTQAVTEPASGAVPLAAGFVFKPLAITDAAGTTTDAATVYVEGPQTGVTPTGFNDALRVKAGTTRLQGGLALNRTTVADAAYTVLTSDYLVAYTSLTATRAVTLPTAASASGQVFVVKDEAGTAGTNPITIVGTVNGASNPTAVNSNYGSYKIYSTGTGWFTTP